MSLAQHHGVGQSGKARVLVHGTTASEVQSTEIGQPAVASPGPESNGTVHHRQPNKQKHHHGRQTGSFAAGTHHQNGSDTGKHALEETLQNVGKRVDNGRSTKDVLKADVGQRTEELAS